MIYPRKYKLNLGLPIEFRIDKTEKLRLFNLELNNHLRHYTSALEQVLHWEKKISEDLEFVYAGQSCYDELIFNLKKTIKHKEDIIKKELASLQTSMKNSKKLAKEFERIKPYVKKYFECKKKFTHYKQKMPKIQDIMDAKTKT